MPDMLVKMLDRHPELIHVYDDGYRAQLEEMCIKDNPFDIETNEFAFHVWEFGWLDSLGVWLESYRKETLNGPFNTKT